MRIGSLVIGLLLMIGTAQAQIVNVESKRGDGLAEGWHGNVNLSLSFQKNVSNILTYGNDSKVQYIKNRHTLLLLTDLNRVKAAGENFVNQGYWHARYNYFFGERQRVAFEAFQQMQFNSVQLINFRYLSGAGIGLRLVENDTLKLRAGTLPMFEYEELTTGAIERNIRQSSYLLFFIDLGSVEFQTINYYQPVIGRWSDYRLSSASTMSIELRKWLRFNVSFDLLYDSSVPESIPALIYTLKNGVGVQF